MAERERLLSLPQREGKETLLFEAIGAVDR